MRALYFYVLFYWAAIKSRAEYRVDFWLGIFTAILSQLGALSFYWVIFSQTDALGGWQGQQVLFLFGLTALVLSVSELFCNGIWMLPFFVINGELDRLLVCPPRSLTLLLASRPELHAVGNFLTGSALTLWVWSQTPPPSAAYWLLGLWVFAGVVVYTSGLVLLGCLSILLVGPFMHHLLIVHHLLNTSRYPTHIFPRSLQTLVVFVFPVAVAIVTPARWLRGEVQLTSAVVLPILAALSMALVASYAWRFSIRRYESTGS